jgi:hypothetical protein
MPSNSISGKSPRGPRQKRFRKVHRVIRAQAGGCGLFRVATISPVPSIGAENSESYGGSPLAQTLRLAWTYAPTPGKL